MDEARTIAWIMFALALASQREPANFAAISGVADGINHAVPTHRELESSLKWLVASGMARKQGSGYLLTEQGLMLMESFRGQNSTTSQVWAALTSALGTFPGLRSNKSFMGDGIPPSP